MIEGKKCIAIIPARSGSKGVEDKNIKDLNGKPLIAHTIEFSLSSKIIDYTLVSTDSEKYAQIARDYGAETPFIRPKELAQDNSKGIDVFLHAIDWIEGNIQKAHYIFTLQPTTPFREITDIENIVRLYKEKQPEAVISVCEVEHPPEWIYHLGEDYRLTNLLNKKPPQNRQECQKYYRLNGAYYFSTILSLLKNKSFLTEKSIGYVMPIEKSIDIDSELDFRWAEFILKQRIS